MDIVSRIKRPLILANNFEIKHAIIQTIQANHFGGALVENPNAYIARFLKIYDMFKHNGVFYHTIKLRLFLFSLIDEAKC